MDWRSELGNIVDGHTRKTRAERENAAFENFLQQVAQPALEEVAAELRKHGREVAVRVAPASVKLQARDGELEEITFGILKKYVQTGILPCAEVRVACGTGFLKYESPLRSGPQNYELSSVTGDEVIACFLKYYRMAMGDRTNA